MKKVFIVFFGIILFVSMTACKSKKHEIVFITNEKIKTLGEYSLLDNIENNKELNFDFENVSVNNQEELLGYLRQFSNSKNKNSRTFVISEAFSNISNVTNEEFKDFNFIYLNKQDEGNFNINIDQRHISYLYGIISGLITRENNVSVIYSQNLVDSSKNMLAFINGVKQVNLKAYDYLSTMKNILDVSTVPAEEKQGTIDNFIKNTKSDVIFYLDTINENIANIFNQSTKVVFSLNEDKENPYIKISYPYEKIIEDIIINNNKNYFVNLIDDTINIDVTQLPEEVQNVVNTMITNMKTNGIGFPNSFEELKK